MKVLPGAPPDTRVLDSTLMSLRRAAIAIVLTICLGAPVVEIFEHWDRSADQGNDTELSTVVVALCVGVALSAAGALAGSLRSIASAVCAHLSVATEVAPSALALVAVPFPCSRPPALLRS